MNSLSQNIQNSPYRHVYYFARDLINTDKFGALGTKKEAQMLELINLIESLITQDLTDDEKLLIVKKTLREEIPSMFGQSKNKYKADVLLQELDDSLTSVNEIVVFCFTMKYIVSPINQALKRIPSSDEEFTTKQAKAILDGLGKKGVGKVISTWDNLGERGCLDAERETVVEEFSAMLANITKLNIEHSTLDDNLIMTAFVQEFERRLGQKRKARGGRSLESVVDFLFSYYHIPETKPEHFDQDLEVDKWFKCSNGWIIGISCKRTLRERWKQLSSADANALSHHKIKEIWHLLSYDSDLSDDKVVRLGMQRQFFYLEDDSEVYLRCKENVGTKEYVRSLSSLIDDIEAER